MVSTDFFDSGCVADFDFFDDRINSNKPSSVRNAVLVAKYRISILVQ